MPFSGASNVPDTLDLLTRAFDEACAELGVTANDKITRDAIALRLMIAARDGERDLDRLNAEHPHKIQHGTKTARHALPNKCPGGRFG